MAQREIKFRYICKDMRGDEFVIMKSLTDFLNEGVNIHTRIQEIIAVNQYTGLLDKNGKEIFEGDKGLFEIKGLGIGEAEVCYAHGSFWLKVDRQKDPLPLHEVEYRDNLSFEVTGNIHQSNNQ